MKTLISFDVDMTLLDHATYKIPDSAMEAIEALRKNHFIVLATGRDMDTYYSRQYRDQIQADAIIHSNGTKITVGDQVLYESVLPRELLERVLHFADVNQFVVAFTKYPQVDIRSIIAIPPTVICTFDNLTFFSYLLSNLVSCKIFILSATKNTRIYDIISAKSIYA